MIISKGTRWTALILAMAVGQSLTAAPQGPRNNQQQAAAAPQPVGPAAASNEELTAFRAVQAETNPATRITLADTFLTTYPSSEFNGYIHRFRMEAFAAQNKHKEAIAAAETALDLENKLVAGMIAKADADAAVKNRPRNAPPPLDKNSPAFKTFLSDAGLSRLMYYQRIMTSYRQLNDAPKAMEYGEKALAQDPENIAFILPVSQIMAERVPASELDKEPHLKRAEELSKKAVTKVAEFLESNGAALPADQKAGFSADVHFTLGTVYLAEKKFGDAEKEFLASLTSKKEPVAYFRLGLAYGRETPPKVDLAMDALAKSVFLKGVTEEQARDILSKLYQERKKSMDGFDDFVKEAGSKIGQ